MILDLGPDGAVRGRREYVWPDFFERLLSVAPDGVVGLITREVRGTDFTFCGIDGSPPRLVGALPPTIPVCAADPEMDAMRFVRPGGLELVLDGHPPTFGTATVAWSDHGAACIVEGVSRHGGVPASDYLTPFAVLLRGGPDGMRGAAIAPGFAASIRCTPSE